MIPFKNRSIVVAAATAIALTAMGLAHAADLPYQEPPPVPQAPPPGYGAAPVYPPAVYPQPFYPPPFYADPIYVPAPIYGPGPIYGPVVRPYIRPFPYRYARVYRGPIGRPYGRWYHR